MSKMLPAALHASVVCVSVHAVKWYCVKISKGHTDTHTHTGLADILVRTLH